jgi:hypothetical protein
VAGLTITTNNTTAVMAADNVGSASAPSSGERTPYHKIDFGAAGSSSPATVANPFPVAHKLFTVSVTLTLDTSAYASGDLLAEAQEVAGVALSSGGVSELVSLMCVDEDDQKVAFDVYLTSASTTWGSENSAPTISDAAARSILAKIPIAAADWSDLGGVAVAQPRIAQNIGVVCTTVGGTSLYVAVINGAGTPTFTASGVKLVFGFRQFN